MSRDLESILADAVRQHRTGALEDAAALYRRVLAEVPAHPDALHLLGVVTLQLGDAGAGERLIRQAILANPMAAAFHKNLGKALAQQGRWDEAVAAQRRAVELAPADADAFTNLGLALTGTGDAPAAEAAHRRAAELNPADRRALRNLGVVRQTLGQMSEAEACFRALVDQDPDDVDALMSLGFIQMEQLALTEARDTLQRLLTLRPDLAKARFNEALIYLLKGEFEDGLAKYESRVAAGVTPERTFDVPRWDGEALGGRTIFLSTEQGFGDAIHFVRYAPLVAAKGGRVVLETAAPLTRLFRSVAGISQMIHPDEPLPPIDCHAPLLSLAHILHTRIETIPAEVPYLAPPAESRARWQAKARDDGRLRVGLAWAGNPGHSKDAGRSIPFETIRPLLAIPRVRFFSLQFGPRAADARQGAADGLVDLSDQLSDFAETAAAIETLDLVVAVDTAVVHLAGALARPAWVLLPMAPDWRWMLERHDTPWYPTLRLFRQARRGDWPGVVAQVADALSAEAARRPVGKGGAL